MIPSLKPMGPRSRDSSRPILSLAPTSELPPASTTSRQTVASPSDPPRFLGPTLLLSHPVPKKNGLKGGLKGLKLNTDPAINGGAPPFQNMGGPIGASAAQLGSTLPEEEVTIKPEVTISPRDAELARRPAVNAVVNGIPQTQDSSYPYDQGHGRLSKPNSERASDSADKIKETIDKLNAARIAPPPPSFPSNSLPPTSNKPSSSSTIDEESVPFRSSSDASSESSPTSTQQTEFSDLLLEEVERLGEGAGGAVHKVRDTRSNIIYARKTITTREVSTRQIMRELSIISSSRHPNIVRCEGFYMSPSSSEVKIVMEYCEGGSLEAIGAKIRERGAIVGEKVAGRIAEGVLQGLAYLHSLKTIHRDIKPCNILLSREGVVKLCDFGVSGELVDSIVGTFTGTLLYMAPERILGKEYTVRSDVWSTGISILELVQNRFPFPNDLPPFEVILQITTADTPKLEDAPGVTWSDDMKDFISQTLIRDATKRPTPKDMLLHPWIVNVMKKDVHMARWIRQVWEWPRSRKDSPSRASSSTAESQNDSPE